MRQNTLPYRADGCLPRSVHAKLALAGRLAFAGLLLPGCTKSSEVRPRPLSQEKPGPGQRDPDQVTAVAGTSWIGQLGIADAFGRLGGTAPPPPSARKEPDVAGDLAGRGPSPGRMGMRGMMRRLYPSFQRDREAFASLMHDRFELSGSDLYRFDCRSCHGPDGTGEPPMINSLIGPIQGTSAAFQTAHMEKLGHPVTQAFAEQLATTAQAAFRQRLSQGGKRMPPFRYLHDDEAEALLHYLQSLAGVHPSNPKPPTVTESVARVGEQLVKGTCHICHDATGPGVAPMPMMQGGIPSLASMPAQLSLGAVVRAVELGSVPMMGMIMEGPTMPAYPYLTQDEVAAAYFYLWQYPPSP